MQQHAQAKIEAYYLLVLSCDYFATLNCVVICVISAFSNFLDQFHLFLLLCTLFHFPFQELSSVLWHNCTADGAQAIRPARAAASQNKTYHTKSLQIPHKRCVLSGANTFLVR